MSNRVEPIRTRTGHREPATGHSRVTTLPRPATAERDARYAGAISLAAALGGILWGVDRARPR